MPLFRKRADERRQELLSAYLDGRVSESERAEVERLLEKSPEARKELQTLRATIAMLKETPVLKPRRSFAIQPSMVQERPKTPSTMGKLQWAVPVAAGAAVLFLTFSLVGGSIGLFEGGGTPTSEDGQQFAAGAPQTSESASPPAATAPPRIAFAPTASAPPPAGTFAPAPTPAPFGTPAPTRTAIAPTGAAGPAGPAGIASLDAPAPTATPAPTTTSAAALKGTQEDAQAIARDAYKSDGDDFPWLAIQLAAGALTIIAVATFVMARRKKAL